MSRDPIEEQGFIPVVGRQSDDELDSANAGNLFRFGCNNPVSDFDALGLWPSQYHFLRLFWLPVKEVHQQAVLRAISGLYFGDDQNLIAAVVWVDSGPHFQDVVNSFMHAMKAPHQSEADARKKANEFVGTHLTAAEEFLCKYCGRDT